MRDVLLTLVIAAPLVLPAVYLIWAELGLGRYRLGRFEPGLLLLVPAVTAIWLFSEGIGFDPDAYYHIGCSHLYATRGWLSSFPWLPFTVLAESFPDVHVGQHLLLAPLTWIFSPAVSLKLGVILLTSALFVSIYLVLKRWGVVHAAIWAALGAFSSPLLVNVNSSLKGGSLFFVLLVWYVDAIASVSIRRAFVLAWLSVYVYVGAPILLPLLAVFVLVRKLWDDVWEARLVLAVFLGLLAGYVVNPYWPDQWIHTARELGTIFFRPTDIAAGEYFGAEWGTVTGRTLIQIAGLYLALWGVVFVHQLGRAAPVSWQAAAGTCAALGLLGISLVSAKFFQLFYITSLLFLPRLFQETRPWPGRWTGPILAFTGLLVACVSLSQSYPQTHAYPNRPPPEEFRRMGEQLAATAPKGQVIVAPWDDFPGLFLFDPDNAFVAGMNPLFLRWASEKRFQAYSLLYRGTVRDPEKLLPLFFGDAEFILVRAKSRNPGERALIAGLTRNPHFEELKTAATTWRLFRLKKSPPAPQPSPSPAPGHP